MANFTLIANNVFKNRSFEDLLKPLAMYTEEYNAQESALNELETKASVWEGLANEEKDPITYAQYKNYADALRAQAENLAQNGLNPSSKKSLLDLKRRYASDIVPIEQAYTNKKAQVEEQRKALMKDPTLLLSRRADMTSLDDYLRDSNLSYDSYSGAVLTSQAAGAAKALAKELRGYGAGKQLDPYTKTWLQQHGFTAGEVARAVNNPDDPRSSKILNSIVNNVMADSGMADWADRSTLNQAYSYARQGLWDAVGETKIDTFEDYGAKLAAKEASEKRIANYKAGINPPQKDETSTLNPHRLLSTKEMEFKGKFIDGLKNAVKNKYLGITRDGKYFLTQKGLKAYAQGAWYADPNRSKPSGDNPVTSFYATISQISGGKGIPIDEKTGKLAKGWGPNQFNNMINNAVSDMKGKLTDLTQDFGYPVEVTPEQSKGILDNMFILNNGEFKVQSFSNGYHNTNETYKYSDIDHIVSIEPTRYGVVANAIIKTGKDDRKAVILEMPDGMGGAGTLDELTRITTNKLDVGVKYNRLKEQLENMTEIPIEYLRDKDELERTYYGYDDDIKKLASEMSRRTDSSVEHIKDSAR